MAEVVLTQKQQMIELRVHHEELLEKIGKKNGTYLAKAKFRNTDKGEDCISFWEAELEQEQDFFIEIVALINKVFIRSQTRTLYKWKYNPFYKEEYTMRAPYGNMTNNTYLIPIDELEEVIVPKKQRPSKEITFDFDLPNPDLDLPFDQMTIRDYAAIHLGKAVSFKPWLNEIIKSK